MSDLNVIEIIVQSPPVPQLVEIGIPGQQGPSGPVSVSVGTTTTLSAGSNATVANGGTTGALVLNFGIPAGAKGDKGNDGDPGETGPEGPPNSLSIGTVSGGETAAASITGTAPSQTLNLVLPKGEKGDTGSQGLKGDTGDAGPANSLSIGTVEDGETAGASITGDAPSQTLNLTLPKGEKGDTGDAGPAGSDGVGVPAGGSTGQALVKTSTDDYDTEWSDVATGFTQVGSAISLSGSSVTITDLPQDADELLFVFSGASSSTSANASMYVSNDNGSTWSSFSYVFVASLSASDAADGAVSFRRYAEDSGSLSGKIANISGSLAASSAIAEQVVVTHHTGGCNAVKIAVSTGSFDAGTVTVFKR
jgi:hypothetical protein